jgi:hypothetical protein
MCLLLLERMGWLGYGPASLDRALGDGWNIRIYWKAEDGMQEVVHHVIDGVQVHSVHSLPFFYRRHDMLRLLFI